MRVSGFSGAESDVPLAAHGFEGVERQAVEYQLLWGGQQQPWRHSGSPRIVALSG